MMPGTGCCSNFFRYIGFGGGMVRLPKLYFEQDPRMATAESDGIFLIVILYEKVY